jgi:hypothetical protein
MSVRESEAHAVAGTAIELQYVGNGQFLPISHEGSITVN